MQFENSFDVSGDPNEVIQAFDDLPLIVSFLPGASLGSSNPDGSYPGSLAVSFGPKRMVFTGFVWKRIDRDNLKGVIWGNANADVRGAKMAVTLNYSLIKIEGSPSAMTRVEFISDAQLTGVLAGFAKTGGVVVTNAILTEFARRFSSYLTDSNLPSDARPTISESKPNSLSLVLIFSEILKSIVRSVLNFFVNLANRIRSILLKP